MSDEEVRAFLAERMVMQCAKNGPPGQPQLVPLWFVADPLRAWTYAKSQKARNLERDPRATLGLEEGVQYNELRGVMFECDVVVHRDVEPIREFGLELFARYGGVNDDVRAMIDTQAPKRVALQFVERSRATWDHRKLGGTY